MSYWQDDYFGSGLPKSKKVVKCWNNHPIYYIDGMPIMGGSCTSHYPEVEVFIGLDNGMRNGDRSYPWVVGDDIFFKIVDRGVPTDLATFKKLLSYTAKQMKKGRSVYVGCIGGHGRTGLFLAALTRYITGDKDAIATVRKGYCSKAVESTSQITWLNKHFGINKLTPSKHAKSGNVLTMGKASGFSGKSDPILSSKGITETTKAKYHCASAKSVFATDKY